MKNLIKKSLAFVLVAALALTCFVGTYSAAEAKEATITIVSKTIAPGTESVDVVLDISSPDAGINEALFKISSDIGTVTNAVLDTETLVATSDAELDFVTYVDDEGKIPADYSNFFLSAGPAKNGADSGLVTSLGAITSAKITVTFAVTATASGTYPINIETSGVKAASPDEDIITLVYTNVGNVVVEEAQTECKHSYDADDNINYVNFTDTGIEYYEVCTACSENIVVETDASENAVAVADKANVQAYYAAINVTAGGSYTIDVDDAQATNLRYAYVKDDKLIANGYHSSLTDGDASNGENAFAATYADGVVTVTADFAGIFVAFVPANVAKLPTGSIGKTKGFSLGASIALTFSINNKYLGNFESVYTVFEHEAYSNNTPVDIEPELNEEFEVTQSGANYYYKFTKPIAAKELGDNVSCTYYGVLDGVDYTLREEVAYNVFVYATADGAGYNSNNDKIRTLMSTMLEYGARAQKYFGYRTDTIVTDNKLISDLFAKYPPMADIAKEDLEYVNESSKYEGERICGFSKGLSLESNIEANFTINFSYFHDLGFTKEDLNDIEVKIYYKSEYDDGTGEFAVDTLAFADGTETNETNKYMFKAKNIPASMAHSECIAEVYYKGERRAYTKYSVNGYVYASYDSGYREVSGGITLGEICRSIATYGAAARAYFASL